MGTAQYKGGWVTYLVIHKQLSFAIFKYIIMILHICLPLLHFRKYGFLL